MKKISIIVLILFFVPSIVFANTLQTLHETYKKINNVEADFTQSVAFEGFDTTATSKGKVYFKRGKMRWDYAEPTRQQIFVDGETVLHYTPENKQVLQSVLGKQTGLPIDLFFSIDKIEALFNLSQEKKNIPKGHAALILKPKEKGSQVTQMIVTLAPLPKVGGLFIQKIILHEENGNQSTFQFKNFRVNKTLADQVFSFKIPAGVELVDLR